MQAAETSQIAGCECQRLLPSQGDASQPRLELSPLTERTEDGRHLRILVEIDEFTRECLAIEVARSFTARDVIMTLQYLFAVRGAPEHPRSDSGPEFVAKEIQEWLERACVRTLSIQRASPWENGYVESFSCLAPRRTARPGAVLEPHRGTGRSRPVAKRLQPQTAARRPELDDACGIRRWPR
jgi:transposase InsO family protein